MLGTADYSLSKFIEEAEKVVRNNTSETETLRRLNPLLERLIQNPISTEAFKPREDKYAMNLAYMPDDEVFSVIAAVWRSSQTTPIHDHLTWALVGVYDGQEKETLYRRTDDGSNPKLARLEMVSERVNSKGHVTVLGEAGIHRVDNPFSKPALSIHVYGMDIGNAERHTYDPLTGKIGTFVSGYCNVLRDPDRF